MDTGETTNMDDQQNQDFINAAVANFERENPVVAEAMKVMNISYKEYLAALSALQASASTTTNSTQITF